MGWASITGGGTGGVALSTARACGARDEAIMAARAALDGNSDLGFPLRIDRVTSNLLLEKNCRGIEDLVVLGVEILLPNRVEESKGFVVEEEAIVIHPLSCFFYCFFLCERLEASPNTGVCLEGVVMCNWEFK